MEKRDGLERCECEDWWIELKLMTWRNYFVQKRRSEEAATAVEPGLLRTAICILLGNFDVLLGNFKIQAII